jgi:hypothetical protein
MERALVLLATPKAAVKQRKQQHQSETLKYRGGTLMHQSTFQHRFLILLRNLRQYAIKGRKKDCAG